MTKSHKSLLPIWLQATQGTHVRDFLAHLNNRLSIFSSLIAYNGFRTVERRFARHCHLEKLKLEEKVCIDSYHCEIILRQINFYTKA